MDLLDILRYSYLGAALAVILVAVTPSLRDRLLAYGARTSSRPLSSAEKEKKQDQAKQKGVSSSNVVSIILDEIASWEVPHDWFWTFYFMSLSLCTFWPGEALYLKGPLYGVVAQYTRTMTSTMSFEQVKITWIMMLVQGGRRLYECLTLTEGEEESFGSSRPASMMFAGHWVLGMLFYSALSVAFWIEGIPALEAHQLSFRDLIFKAPTFRTTFSIILFILASGFQHDCHAYLAYLKKSRSKSTNGKEQDASESKYKLPSHPAFQPLIAPHYTAECLIYLSLALVSAPQGEWVNVTMLCAMVFVVVNLGVTADGTKRWYERRFGAEAVKGKWRMIPLLY
ncbi:hypothetical protein LTR37_001772 [Vermiconidia calcicola]|uniref:Uncharacterized protein n=1 Tax=Vermiconidia calcicola TaxID=1690605 RepID=A0ACC3NV33_9PEZI|nr:hypothetical protein LTR37_001772 [Vermiconidia calcicola]